MKTRKERWKELLPYEKKFDVATLVFSCAVVIVFIFEVLDRFNVLPVSFDLFIIVQGLLALASACSAVVLWRTERRTAKGNIALAIVFAILAITKFFF